MSAKGTWRVSVQNYTPPNHAPVFDNVPGSLSVDENSLLEFTIHATDPDGDKVTYSVSNLPAGAVFDSQTGVFSWTPSYTQSGTYQVTFNASDGDTYASKTIDIIVNDVNAPATGVSASLSGTIYIGNGSVTLNCNVDDFDGGTNTSGTGIYHNGQLLVSGEGTYTADGTIPKGETLEGRCTADGLTDSAFITVSDTLPTIDCTGIKSIYNEGDNMSIACHIVDPDPGDDYTPTVTGVRPEGVGVSTNINYVGIGGTIGPNAGDCAGGLCSYSNTISVPGASKTVDYSVNNLDSGGI